MEVRDISESIQQLIEAIADVLKVDVEIADIEYVRVAGTGKSGMGLLRKQPGQDYVFKKALESGKPVIIEHAGTDDTCVPCTHYGSCTERGEIAVPFYLNGLPQGVIGLIAYTEEQRERLFSDVSSNLTFLNKISDLIVAKLKEYKIYKEQQVTLQKLQAVMDSLTKGVMTMDSEGNVIQINSYAKEYLCIQDITDQNHNRKKLEVILKAMDKKGFDDTEKVKIVLHGKEMILSCLPIKIDGQLVEWMITFDDLNRMVQIAKQVGGVEANDPFHSILGNSKVINQTKEMARRISNSDSTVLLFGESGTGKELFARAIHQASDRNEHPFISINCGAIPEPLLESELFGYEEGAFTGAKKGGKMGKFEQANGGTIFLDEIGDMPLQLQVKLLRVLQERQIERIGSTVKQKAIDIRVIAATHRDLEEMVRQGSFREDLFYRLNVIPLSIPCLKERREDILSIANHYLQLYGERLKKNIQGFTIQAQDYLIHYHWPGNVRELANTIEYAVNMETTSYITEQNLPAKILVNTEESTDQGDRYMFEERWMDYDLKKIEKRAITYVLKKFSEEKSSKDQAAEVLGISRATLFRKIKEYNIRHQ